MYYHITPEEAILLREEMFDKYSEYLEMLGDQAPNTMINVLCKIILQQRKHIEYQSKILRYSKNECACTTDE